jgi:putative ABC transport system permease protein
MKYISIIIAALRRKKVRTGLTILSITVAFLLFGLLWGVTAGLDAVVTRSRGDRLFTSNRYNPLQGIPISYMGRIANVPGVTKVAPWVYLGAFFKDKRSPLGVFATNVDELFDLYTEFKIDHAALEAMKSVRNGALITTDLAKQYQWKIGDEVPIGTSMWPDKRGETTYHFRITGIYERGGTPINGFLIRYDYFDEARRDAAGTVHYYITGVNDPTAAVQIGHVIDGLFDNSANETRTQTEQVYLVNASKQIADISFMTKAVLGAVFFTLLLIAGTAMSQSVRERMGEIALMRAIGFGEYRVMALIWAEATVITVISAAAGIGVARLLFGPLTAFIGFVYMPASVSVIGMLIAVLMGLVVSAAPLIRVGRQNVVDALGRF